MKTPLCRFTLIPGVLLLAISGASAQDEGTWTPAHGGTPPGPVDDVSDEIADRTIAEDEVGYLGANLPDWLSLEAEYRVRTTMINSLELSGDQIGATDWTEHRFRTHIGFEIPGVIGIHSRIDILDGVLFGDNGEFTEDPPSNTGVGVATHQPNSTTVTVGLPEGEDPLNPDSYVPVLEGQDIIEIDHLYADVFLPIGLLRVGRQPNLGVSIGSHDGERNNRWGVSSYADGGDRILFATKLDEAVRIIRSGGQHQLNPSLEEGVFLAGWYEFFNQGSLLVGGDNLRQLGTTLMWRQPELQIGSSTWRDVGASGAFVNLGGDDFETNIFAIPMLISATIGRVSFSANASFIRGTTREISQGFSALTQSDPTDQELNSEGFRAVVDIDFDRVMLTLELDYASGDDDPRGGSPITSYAYPRDLNVGLLLFERILEFESNRSAGVGLENLRNVQSDSFPLTEVSTDGRFNNAIAAFPQLLIRWVDSREHQFHTRLGALMAWTPVGVVDPIMTVLAEDGAEISDDAVNFHGGDPGSYYGTEFDLQLQWTYRQHFAWTVESAALLPGDALQDEHGDATPAFLVENRFEFLFW